MEKPKRFKVLIYEPEHSGHHMADLSRLLPAILGLPVDVVIAVNKDCMESEAFRVMMKPFQEAVEWDTSCHVPHGNPLLIQINRFIECRRLTRQHQVDHIFVMMSDGLWQIIALFGLLGFRPWHKSIKSDTYIIAGKFSYPESTRPRNRLVQFLFKRLIRQGVFSRILALDEQLAEFANRHQLSNNKTQVILSPAPIPQFTPVTKSDARKKLGLPQNSRIILMMGMIYPYRGAMRVLQAYEQYDDKYAGSEDVLVTAGPHSDDVIEHLQTSRFTPLAKSGRLFYFNRYLNDEELHTFAAACDLLTIGTHMHQGRSSVILWAAANGRPVVTTDTGTIGYVVETNRLGYTCDVTNPKLFAATWHLALSKAWTDHDKANAINYANWSRLDNYQEIGNETIRESLS